MKTVALLTIMLCANLAAAAPQQAEDLPSTDQQPGGRSTDTENAEKPQKPPQKSPQRRRRRLVFEEFIPETQRNVDKDQPIPADI